jgi:hypothetical protein
VDVSTPPPRLHLADALQPSPSGLCGPVHVDVLPHKDDLLVVGCVDEHVPVRLEWSQLLESDLRFDRDADDDGDDGDGGGAARRPSRVAVHLSRRVHVTVLRRTTEEAILKALWASQAHPSLDAVFEKLSVVSDTHWVVKECLDRVPHVKTVADALLEVGIQRCVAALRGSQGTGSGSGAPSGTGAGAGAGAGVAFGAGVASGGGADGWDDFELDGVDAAADDGSASDDAAGAVQCVSEIGLQRWLHAAHTKLLRYKDLLRTCVKIGFAEG